MIRHQDERSERVEALKTRYLRNEISEAVFRASLHGVGGMTAEDIRHKLNEFAPPPREQTFEERRLEVSHKWLKDYFDDKNT
mgnify:CR=1 FL=1